jgi:hypothetical protein
MSNISKVLFDLDPMEDAPIIPTISKAVLLDKFSDNDGIVVNRPQYAADETSFGNGRIARPPGQLILPSDLMKIRAELINDLAMANLELGAAMSLKDKNNWDRVVGESLEKNLSISLAQANNQEVWAYLTLFVFWDFPTWRFPGRKKEVIDFDDELPKSKFERSWGSARNVLRRCWIRAHVLGPDLGSDGLSGTVEPLQEDELTNLFERSTLGNNKQLIQAMVKTIYIKQPISDKRMHPTRRFAKAVLHRTPTTHFGALGDKLLPVLSDIYDSVNPNE